MLGKSNNIWDGSRKSSLTPGYSLTRVCWLGNAVRRNLFVNGGPIVRGPGLTNLSEDMSLDEEGEAWDAMPEVTLTLVILRTRNSQRGWGIIRRLLGCYS